eukprot:NODE_11870_length_1260_cov_8.432480.p1 GENE.NODE_11870_length_1260_cov_8.432480~~NODE_11870_length_1260_cov_8.432480.p1  ORF type:complete len:337 (+),score=83.36 NODE_11870_length_1260_cov_8.432480:106-1011(+)
MRPCLTLCAAGHTSTILKDFSAGTGGISRSPMHILKPVDNAEISNYNLLQNSKDPLLKFLPTYGGIQGEHFRLTNLLKDFHAHPHVMDVKMGTRSFTEHEVSISTPRPDLYERLCKLDPNAPTVEEHAQSACTKYRWMMHNDTVTHMSTLGFRIDGIICGVEAARVPQDILKKNSTVEECARCFLTNGLPDVEPMVKRSIAEAFISELKEMRELMESSPFVESHSFVGASLVFIADRNGMKTAVKLIDLAKILVVPEGITIDHRSAWQVGTYEDGLFLGLDNLTRCWQLVYEMIALDTTPR